MTTWSYPPFTYCDKCGASMQRVSTGANVCFKCMETKLDEPMRRIDVLAIEGRMKRIDEKIDALIDEKTDLAKRLQELKLKETT